jgi:hypothetical protein
MECNQIQFIWLIVTLTSIDITFYMKLVIIFESKINDEEISLKTKSLLIRKVR